MIFFTLCRVGLPSRLSLLQAHVIPSVNPTQPLRLLQKRLGIKSRTSDCRHYSKQDQLAVSHPRLYKLHEQERIRDNLSKDWKLIFAPNRGLKSQWKQLTACWACFVGYCALPIAGIFGWVEAELEERVIMAGIEMSAQTQWVMFMALNILIVANISRYFRCIPKRVYYNEKKDSYLAVKYHFFPWKSVWTEYQSTDIRDFVGRRYIFRFNPAGHSEYKINNKTFIFPVNHFRSGHDREWMLRHKNLNC